MSGKCNVLFWRDRFQHLACKQSQSYFLFNKSGRLIEVNQPLWAKTPTKKEKVLKIQAFRRASSWWQTNRDPELESMNWLVHHISHVQQKASNRLPNKSFIPYKCICIALCWYINAWALNSVWCHSPALVLVSHVPTATVRQGKCHQPGKNEWHSIFLE